MNQHATTTQTRAIVIEDFLAHSPEMVWKALTTREYLDRWLMKNDFELTVGHKFTFQARPMGDWNGIVNCQVLEADPPRKLVYSWVGGSANNAVHGSILDSVLTFELTPADGGTRLKLTHDGFRSPRNDAGYEAMSGGWGGIVKRIEALLNEAA